MKTYVHHIGGPRNGLDVQIDADVSSYRIGDGVYDRASAYNSEDSFVYTYSPEPKDTE